MTGVLEADSNMCFLACEASNVCVYWRVGEGCTNVVWSDNAEGVCQSRSTVQQDSCFREDAVSLYCLGSIYLQEVLTQPEF